MTKKNANEQTIVPAIGSILAWESQAQGSWKVKIGRVVGLPPVGADARTSSGKIALEILATYCPPEDKGGMYIPDALGVGALGRLKKMEFKAYLAPYKIGRATTSQIRIPKAWETQHAGVKL